MEIKREKIVANDTRAIAANDIFDARAIAAFHPRLALKFVANGNSHIASRIIDHLSHANFLFLLNFVPQFVIVKDISWKFFAVRSDSYIHMIQSCSRPRLATLWDLLRRAGNNCSINSNVLRVVYDKFCARESFLGIDEELANIRKEKEDEISRALGSEILIGLPYIALLTENEKTKHISKLMELYKKEIEISRSLFVGISCLYWHALERSKRYLSFMFLPLFNEKFDNLIANFSLSCKCSEFIENLYSLCAKKKEVQFLQ